MKNYSEALKLIQNNVSIIGAEELDTQSANGAIAEDIISSNAVPCFSNSAMDGYCLNSELTNNASAENPVELPIKGIIFAGDEPPSNIKDSEAYEIMTGSKMPDELDTVLPVEKGELIEKEGSKFLVLNEPIKKDLNVRKSGEDFKKDELILSKGALINDHRKIALVMNHKKTIRVFKNPGIGILTTGNELDGTSAASVPNSNGPFLESSVQSVGLECLKNLHAGDDINQIIDQIQKQ